MSVSNCTFKTSMMIICYVISNYSSQCCHNKKCSNYNVKSVKSCSKKET